jgi:hypothetical protein
MQTQGRRVHPTEKGFFGLAEGDYLKDLDGLWWLRPPGGQTGVSLHTITEHEDGTISAKEMIRVPGFRGYLERGTWRRA